MMKRQYTSCGLQALRFRRWSRKGYAAFVSRQRACTMGTLRCHIVERLQQKNGMPLAYLPVCDCPYETADALAGDTGGVPADLLPAALAFFVTACYGVTADAAAPGVVLSIDNEIFPAGDSGYVSGISRWLFGGGSFWKELLKKRGLFALTGGLGRCRSGVLFACHCAFFPGKETKVEKVFAEGWLLPGEAGNDRYHGGFSFLLP